jgi:uncharacterized protein YjbI with pentapeptide repeats
VNALAPGKRQGDTGMIRINSASEGDGDPFTREYNSANRDIYNAGHDIVFNENNYYDYGLLSGLLQELLRGPGASADARFRDALKQLSTEQVSIHAGALDMLAQAAQAEPRLRQDVVDVLCAYLSESPPPAGSPKSDNWHRARGNCQRILARHLKPAKADLKKRRLRSASTLWRDIDLHLMGARLHNLNLSGCCVRSARFDGAIFTGCTKFNDSLFYGPAVFADSVFHGPAEFMGSRFSNHAWFTDVRFGGDAIFGAMLSGGRVLSAAVFHGNAWFRGAKFSGSALFNSAQFSDQWNAAFEDTDFTEDALFIGTSMRYGTFSGAAFRKGANFYGSQFGELWLRGTVFCGDITFAGVNNGQTIYLHKARLLSRESEAPSCVLPPGWSLRSGREPGHYIFSSRWPDNPNHIGLMISPPPHI